MGNVVGFRMTLTRTYCCLLYNFLSLYIAIQKNHRRTQAGNPFFFASIHIDTPTKSGRAMALERGISLGVARIALWGVCSNQARA